MRWCATTGGNVAQVRHFKKLVMTNVSHRCAQNVSRDSRCKMPDAAAILKVTLESRSHPLGSRSMKSAPGSAFLKCRTDSTFFRRVTFAAVESLGAWRPAPPQPKTSPAEGPEAAGAGGNASEGTSDTGHQADQTIVGRARRDRPLLVARRRDIVDGCARPRSSATNRARARRATARRGRATCRCRRLAAPEDFGRPARGSPTLRRRRAIDIEVVQGLVDDVLRIAPDVGARRSTATSGSARATPRAAGPLQRSGCRRCSKRGSDERAPARSSARDGARGLCARAPQSSAVASLDAAPRRARSHRQRRHRSARVADRVHLGNVDRASDERDDWNGRLDPGSVGCGAGRKLLIESFQKVMPTSTELQMRRWAPIARIGGQELVDHRPTPATRGRPRSRPNKARVTVSPH